MQWMQTNSNWRVVGLENACRNHITTVCKSVTSIPTQPRSIIYKRCTCINYNSTTLHWLNISERIEYKLLSLTYKVLTTSQPDYLHNPVSVQSSGRTRSSSVVTLARPSVPSSLQITNRSFRYASPYLWNQLPSLFRQPHHSHHLRSAFESTLNSRIVSYSITWILNTITVAVFWLVGMILAPW